MQSSQASDSVAMSDLDLGSSCPPVFSAEIAVHPHAWFMGADIPTRARCMLGKYTSNGASFPGSFGFSSVLN